MTLRRRLAPALAFVLTVLWPAVALACPVCGGGSPRNRDAFLSTTAFLSLLPLALIGVGLVWLRRVGAGHLAAELEDRDAPAGGAAEERPR